MNKQQFISQLMRGESTSRSCEEMDDKTLTFAEMQAIASGDPEIQERFELEQDIKKLHILEAGHRKEIFGYQDTIAKAPGEIKRLEGLLEQAKSDNSKPFQQDFWIEIGGTIYDERPKADAHILAEVLKFKQNGKGKDVIIGSYNGFDLSLTKDSFGDVCLELHGELSYRTEAGTLDSARNSQRVENIQSSEIDKRVQQLTPLIERNKSDLASAEAGVNTPFKQADELREKQTRLSELNSKLTSTEGEPVFEAGEEFDGEPRVAFHEQPEPVREELPEIASEPDDDMTVKI